MKLSKIIETENLSSVTIEIKRDFAICKFFIYGRKMPFSKKYKSVDIDVEINDTSIETVRHLCIKRYRFLKTDTFYVNLYNY